MTFTKLYCYVDETGQDTKGEFFLVAVVLNEMNNLHFLEKKLKHIEQETNKKLLKWKKTNNTIKRVYLRELIQIKELKSSIFYSQYRGSKEYPKLTSLTIAKAVLAKDQNNYSVNVIIDGLNNKEREVVRGELKKLRIKYHKIRGMKDEQNVFLRLADTMAGFLRDSLEEKAYTRSFIKRFRVEKIVTET